MIKINLEKIPHKGFILAIFESGVIFEPYEVKGDEIIFRSMKTLQEVIPTELHLFDQETEFRIVQRESRGDQIELLMTKEQELEMDSDLIYVEETFIKPEYSNAENMPKKLSIVNRYCYSENDTLELQNYRIAFE